MSYISYVQGGPRPKSQIEKWKQSKGGLTEQTSVWNSCRSCKRGDDIGSLFSFKDRFPILTRSSNIYNFQCHGCHDLHNGKTCHLSTLCSENLGVNKAGRKMKASSSAIGDPISQLGHVASFNEFDFLIQESLLILVDGPLFNSQQSSITLVLLSFVPTFSIRPLVPSHVGKM